MSDTMRRNPGRVATWPASAIIAALAIVAAAVAFGWSEYDAYQTSERERPKLALASLVRELREYHERTGRFPASMRELDELKKRTGRRYDLEGRAFTIANYFYVLGRPDAHHATLWAIPTGARRSEASTHFIVVGTETLSHWKGPALDAKAAAAVRPNPEVAELATLGLVEQPGAPERQKPR